MSNERNFLKEEKIKIECERNLRIERGVGRDGGGVEEKENGRVEEREKGGVEGKEKGRVEERGKGESVREGRRRVEGEEGEREGVKY